MTTYISILRGINVSGQRIIKMDALKKLFETMGFKSISTYIQSGNVIFQSDNLNIKILEQMIAQKIKDDFGFEVPSIVLTIDNLRKIIKNNPFIIDPSKNSSFIYLTFLESKPEIFDIKKLTSKKSEEEIKIMNDVAYLYCPNGYGKTKLNNNFLENTLKVKASTRNWKSVNELLKIAEEI